MIKFIKCVDGTSIPLKSVRSFWFRPCKKRGRYHVRAILNTLVMVDVVDFGMEVCAIEACNTLNAIKVNPARYGGSQGDTFNCATDFIGYL